MCSDVVGETNSQITVPPGNILHSPKVSDFRLGKEIGQGSFSCVYVAREIATQNEFAIKVVNKKHVCRNKAILSVLMEKEVLKRTNHPLIIRLYYTFQDNIRLYYVLQYAIGGELLTYLNRLTSFNKRGTQFYSAEILIALDYLHSHSIVHRDLKPENVLLTADMHIKLADFGSAIILNDPSIKAPSFTGTLQYVSPEMLYIASPSDLSDTNCHEPESSTMDDSTGFSSLAPSNSGLTNCQYLMDYWALGCMIYQMLSGRPPFRPGKHEHEYGIFRKVLNLEYSFPNGFDEDGKDLVSNLLVTSTAKRLGSPALGGPETVRSHKFFEGLDWEHLIYEKPPDLVPNLDALEHDESDYIKFCSFSNPNPHIPLELNAITCELSNLDRVNFLKKQEQENVYNRFARGRLILKQGLLYKRRGLFARKRMFLLTEGPHLHYVDPNTMVRKGEIPWSNFVYAQYRSDKIFSIIVPNRVYYLEDPSGHSQEWIEKLRQVKAMYYNDPIDR